MRNTNVAKSHPGTSDAAAKTAAGTMAVVHPRQPAKCVSTNVRFALVPWHLCFPDCASEWVGSV